MTGKWEKMGGNGRKWAKMGENGFEEAMGGLIYLIYFDLFSFFPVGRGTLLQVSPITPGPL